MNQGIYKIINTHNNKFYVGSAVNLRRRKNRHFSELRRGKHNNRYVQRAWDKYGEDAFIFVVIEEVEDRDKLLDCEDKWLIPVVGTAQCYNIGVTATAPQLGCFGKDNHAWGRKHTAEAKKRIGEAAANRVQTEEEKNKRRVSMKGHTVKQSTRDKISKTLQGAGNYWYGKKRPEFAKKVRRVVTEVTTNTEFDSLTAARTKYSMTTTAMSRALKADRPIIKGPNKGLWFRRGGLSEAQRERARIKPNKYTVDTP